MNKDPLTWTANKLSKGKYADYQFPVMVDGIGIRGSIYVSGCLFNCIGCYNKKVQNFNWGKEYTQEVEDQILKDMAQDYCDGLTLLGGEPFLNTQVLLPLVKRVKTELTGKTVWSWTGYTFEELTTPNTKNWEDKLELLSYLDVLVDGRFEQDKFNPNLVFRGSWNQRIIDVPKSLEQGRVVLWQEGKYLEGEDHTPVKPPSSRKG